MIDRIRRFGLLAALVTAGCAHASRADEHALAFPGDFSLLQVVEVERGESKMAFVASLRRRGGDFELAMLDPVLQRPLYEAHTEGGKIVETRPLPDEAQELGAMLFQSLQQFFEAKAFQRSGSALTFEGERFLFEFEPWDARAICPFPAVIHMRARGKSPKMRVVATTEDVACGGHQAE